MSEEPTTTILTPVGITTTGIDNEKVFYQILGKDKANNTFIMTFACPAYIEESVTKYLRRLQPVDVEPEPAVTADQNPETQEKEVAP